MAEDRSSFKAWLATGAVTALAGYATWKTAKRHTLGGVAPERNFIACSVWPDRGEETRVIVTEDMTGRGRSVMPPSCMRIWTGTARSYSDARRAARGYFERTGYSSRGGRGVAAFGSVVMLWQRRRRGAGV